MSFWKKNVHFNTTYKKSGVQIFKQQYSFENSKKLIKSLKNRYEYIVNFNNGCIQQMFPFRCMNNLGSARLFVPR